MDSLGPGDRSRQRVLWYHRTLRYFDLDWLDPSFVRDRQTCLALARS